MLCLHAPPIWSTHHPCFMWAHGCDCRAVQPALPPVMHSCGALSWPPCPPTHLPASRMRPHPHRTAPCAPPADAGLGAQFRGVLWRERDPGGGFGESRDRHPGGAGGHAPHLPPLDAEWRPRHHREFSSLAANLTAIRDAPPGRLVTKVLSGTGAGQGLYFFGPKETSALCGFLGPKRNCGCFLHVLAEPRDSVR